MFWFLILVAFVMLFLDFRAFLAVLLLALILKGFGII